MCVSTFWYVLRMHRTMAFRRGYNVVRGYNIVLYRIQTYLYRDRYKVLIERRTVLYAIGTIKSRVRDLWYGTIVYRIMD